MGAFWWQLQRSVWNALIDTCTSNLDGVKLYGTSPELKKRLVDNGIESSRDLFRRQIDGDLIETCTQSPDRSKPLDFFSRLKRDTKNRMEGSWWLLRSPMGSEGLHTQSP